MLPPTGHITLLFTDIEGSTVLWENEPTAMAKALARHDDILRRSIERNGGFVFKTVGDAFCAAFSSARSAISACLQAQLQLQQEQWNDGLTIRVRMGLHSGSPQLRDDDYFGPPVNRVARTQSLANGEQVIMTQATFEDLAGDLPAKVTLEDLGVHKLKDIDVPERIYMMVHPNLRSDFPKLRSAEIRSHNLPPEPSAFVGREREVAQVNQLLRENPVVTLIGAGGTGKSRLALKIASESLDYYPDGVWWVDLAPLSEPEFVDQEIASVLGVREIPGRPVQETLLQFLAKRELLLVVDNCEHLASGVQSTIQEIADRCHGVRSMVTTREPIRHSGERIFRVPSLGLPGDREMLTPENILEFEATRLFVERARQAQAGFVVTDGNANAIANICRQVDGIAFAIELAATRTRTMTIEQIDQRIQNRLSLLSSEDRADVSRRQTLRAMLDWSYGMLDDAEKAVLNRLGVFAGGFTTPAAVAITTQGARPDATQVEDWEVVDLLTRLSDKSLVVMGEAFGEHRYKLLETVRQYSREMLATAEETDLAAQAHLKFFTDFAETAEEHLQGANQAEWLDRLETDHDNLRSAITHSTTGAALVEYGYRLTGAIGRFWSVRGYFNEGRVAMDKVLRAFPDSLSIDRATACRTAGQIAYWQGDSVAGRAYAEESLSICRQLGDTRGETISLFRLGFATLGEQDYKAARGYFEQALELGIRIDDRMGIPHLLNAMGEVTLASRSLDEASTYFAQALEKFIEVDDKRSIASVQKNMATTQILLGDTLAARDLLLTSLRLRQELGNENGITRTLDTITVLLSALGRHSAVAQMLGAISALNRAQGSSTEASDLPLLTSAEEAAKGALGDSEYAAAFGVGGGWSLLAACEFAVESM